ncbi:MAG: hypothetical protein KAU03_02685 [Candidatus Altiarchaeales archaeon]|nr:hypothetical protein [Candidatus Altiarchaeales archaeon]
MTKKNKNKWIILVTILVLILVSDSLTAEETCDDQCVAHTLVGCSQKGCETANGLVSGGCWFEGGGILGADHCWSCKDKPVGACENYDKRDCLVNPCGLDPDCGWDSVEGKCTASTTNTCNEVCGMVCGEEECRNADAIVPGGCWFDGVWLNDCWNCDGGDGHGVSKCEHYSKTDCVRNPCGLAGGCELKEEDCVKTGGEPPGPGPGPGIETCACDCTTGDETITIEARGATDEGCAEACGGICGGYVNYEKDLNNNCDNCETYCTDNLVCRAYIDDCQRGCIKACKSVCGLNETIYDLIGIVYNIAGIIAAIMFVIYGFQFMTSANPEDRDNAKQGAMYVILALIMIVIASLLVKLLIGTIPHP